MLSNIKVSNRLIILILVVLNISIKLIFAGYSQVAIDEPFTLYWSQAPLSELINFLLTGNNPPLHSVFMHFWSQLFGIGPFAARFPSVVFSALAVIFVFKTGAKYFNRSTGVIASLLFTFSNLNMLHAHNARAYSLFMLLSIASLYFFFSLTDNTKNKKYILYLTITNLLLIYAHYFGFWVLFFETVIVILVPKFRKASLKSFLLSSLVLLIGYAPVLKIFISRFLISAGEGTWVPQPNFQSLYFMLANFCNQPVTAVFFILAIVGFPIFMRLSKQKMNLHGRLLTLFFWGLYLIMFAVSLKVPMFLPQYLIYITPAFYLFIGIIVFHIGIVRPKVGLIAGGVLVVLMLSTFNIKEGHDRKPKEMVEYVKSLKKDDSCVFIVPPWHDLNFTYHYSPEIFSDFGNVQIRLANENIYPVYNATEFKPGILENSSSVIYIDAGHGITDPDNSVMNALVYKFIEPKQQSDFKHYKVYYFE